MTTHLLLFLGHWIITTTAAFMVHEEIRHSSGKAEMVASLVLAGLVGWLFVPARILANMCLEKE